MLEELKEQYRNSLPEKIRTLETHLQDLRAGQASALEGIRLLAHSLHGSGSTFGYPVISAAARRVEHADPADVEPHLRELIGVLQATAALISDKTRNILIIEDDRDISNLLKVLIGQKSSNYRVFVAANAAEATALLSQHALALVLLDLVLPDTDGRILLRQIKATVPLEVPVFVLSGIDRESVRAECLTLGAKGYFNKPFDPVRIAADIDAELNGQPKAANDAPVASKPVAKTRNPILVAEDDDLLASIIRHRLTREGLVVEHVTSGDAALAALKNSRYSLVILDVKMPVVDGFEVLTRIRSGLGEPNVPVIMLTAMGSEKDVVRGYELGANDYIVKPFSPVELLARVKSLLRTG